MLHFSNTDIENALDHPALITALRQLFSGEFTMPLRHHHFYKDNTLILMPSWTNEFMGIKQVIVAPGNAQIDLPSIHALYTLLDARTGQPLAMMNAALLTSMRTACTSALAADYLAPQDARTLLVAGTGKVARHMVPAHKSVRQYDKVMVWGRNTAKAVALQALWQSEGHTVEVAEDLETAVRAADVIACATMTETPIIKGAWLKPGQHLDLVGSYKPGMREVDDDAILASTLFADSRAGALHESGELGVPIHNGLITAEDVQADIVEFCTGAHPGRRQPQEITLFKSMGLAIEDLAAALLVYQKRKA